MSIGKRMSLMQHGGAGALLVVASLAAAAQEMALPAPLPKLVMVVSAGTASSPNGVALRMIYGEVGRRIGYQIDLLPLPTSRATAVSDKGEVDGELNRVADYGSAHSNMLRVSPSHFSVNFIAFGRDSIEVGNGWQALAASGLRVDYVRGCKKCETELPKVVPAERLAGVNSLLLALRKLHAGRSDLVVDIDNEIESVMAMPEFSGSQLRRRGVMEAVDMHAYLHKKNAALVPKLGAALAAMKREGLLEKYKQLAASPSQ